MDYSKKQTELDIQKWNDSQAKCHDTCGEYNYCKNCNKTNSYPCAYAYETFYAEYKPAKTTTRKKTTTTTSIAKKSTSTVASKKTTTRKTTAKKVTVANA